MYIYATMLSVMDFVMSHYWIASGANLDAGQCIPIDIIVFDQTSALAKNIHATLVTVVDLVFPYSWIAIRCYPNACK